VYGYEVTVCLRGTACGKTHENAPYSLRRPASGTLGAGTGRFPL